MDSFRLLRTICRFIGIISSVLALVSIIVDFKIGIIIGVIFLVVDLIVIAIKNRCPFCHKSLRIAPIKGEEHCPYCGCEIRCRKI